MGVINNQPRTRTFTSDSTDSNQLQDLLEELNIRHTRTRVDDSRTASLDRHARQPRRRQLKKPVGFPKPELTFRGLGCRGKSRRKLQRYENGNLLHQSLAFLGIDGSDMDDFDLVPQRLSVFARLLMEEESLMVWYDFISKSEEEQELFLSCSRKKTKQR